MLQPDEFPKNILAALDGLAKLGIALQSYPHPSEAKRAILHASFKSAIEEKFINKEQVIQKLGKDERE